MHILAEQFLNRNGSDPMKALEAACQELATLSRLVSPGYVRWPPSLPTLPPKKPPPEPIDKAWPDPGAPE
jgi:hypothetical protein